MQPIHHWSLKPAVVTITLYAFALSGNPASAASQTEAISLCSSADHGAMLLGNPVVQMPDGTATGGLAVVRVDLASSGRITNIALAQSSGDVNLDFAALRVVESSRFVPASIACHAAGDAFLYNVNFEDK